MNKKGIVTELSGSFARVTFPDLDNIVTGLLPIIKYDVKCQGECHCSGCMATLDIKVGSCVLVCLYDNDYNSGIIMAKLE